MTKINNDIDVENIFCQINENINLSKYASLIEQTNKKFNISGLKSFEQIFTEGIVNSILSLCPFEKLIKNKNVLDIGSGCGFPLVPYLIFLNNSFSLTIIESNKKRIEFLKTIKNYFNLNLNLICKRAEEVDDLDEKFDFISARAVAKLNALIEISSRFGKINSYYAFLKGTKYKEEIENSKQIIDCLGIDKINVLKLDLIDKNDNVVLYYEKSKKTPMNYPRKWSTIKKEIK